MGRGRFLILLLFSIATIAVSAQSGAKQQNDCVEIEKFPTLPDSLVNVEEGRKELEEVDYDDTTKPFVTVEQMPSFPGGETEMHKFISENLKIPIEPREEGICTRFTARFVIREDGSITDIRMMRGCSETLDKEVVKMIKKMPMWIPGKQNGKTVPVYFTLGMHIRVKI